MGENASGIFIVKFFNKIRPNFFSLFIIRVAYSDSCQLMGKLIDVVIFSVKRNLNF